MPVMYLLVLLFVQLAFTQLPPSWDWRTKKVVPFVSDQGDIGAASHYAAIEAMESAWAIKSGQFVILSLQNLIDCAPDPPSIAGDIEYVIQNAGIDTEASYPTTGTRGPCRYNPTGKGAFFSSTTNVTGGDEAVLAEIVANIGPVAVMVDSSSWEFYQGGVDSSACGQVDHAALVVGYTPDYWIVQNSWGTSWGMKGYIQVARNKGNSCCIASGGMAAVV